MKKVSIICVLLLLISFSSIALYSSPRSLVGLFANGIESLTDDDDPLGEIVVTGAKTLYHFQTQVPYQGVYNVTVSFIYEGEIYVSCIDLYMYEAMWCCGDGYDDCHPFTPDKTPWKCLSYRKGKNFWD